MYYVYITTNPGKTVLYIGVTNDLYRRLAEHYENRGNTSSFAGRYYCYNLVYYEELQCVNDAIAREKELKQLSRKEKELIIRSVNPNMYVVKI